MVKLWRKFWKEFKMERKELNLKDLEAIAAGYHIPFNGGTLMLVVSAVDLAATGMTTAILAEKLEVDPNIIQVR